MRISILISTLPPSTLSLDNQQVGCIVYAAVTAAVLSLLESFNRYSDRFREVMHECSGMMRDHNIPREDREAVKVFFRNAYEEASRYDTTSLLLAMSPQLRGTIASHIHRPWLDHCTFLMDAPAGLVAELAKGHGVTVGTESPRF